MSKRRRKPTISELEAILNQPADDRTVTILPNGEIRAVKRPRILTAKQVLGGSY